MNRRGLAQSDGPRISQSGRAATKEAIETRKAETTVQAITGKILGHGWNSQENYFFPFVPPLLHFGVYI